MKTVRALVLTGYGLNCDYETDFSLQLAGAHSERVHVNELIPSEKSNATVTLDKYHILVLGGGFSWADDHGAGVIMASKLRYNIGEQIEKFIGEGKLIIGICNGFQTLVNLGLLPGFEGDYHSRKVALTYNDSGNFVDRWVHAQGSEGERMYFTKGISTLELPVRHGEGKFYAKKEIIDRLIEKNQVVIRYADEKGHPAQGKWPFNPNGSLYDIAGVCDSTGENILE